MRWNPVNSLMNVDGDVLSLSREWHSIASEN